MFRFALSFAALAGGAGLALAGDLSEAEIAAMRAADIVLLGELHDNAAHHGGQATLMAQVAPKAVVFEMLTPQMAAQVNGWGDKPLAELGAAMGWEEAGWPDFEIYLPVFEALEDAVVVGAAAPRETVRAAFQDGAAAVFGAEAARFGLTADLPVDQLDARKDMQFDAHCAAMSLELMGGMVEAQRLRDAQFAQATLQALGDHGGPVVLITGNGHARKDWGVPHAVAQAAPEVITFSVGFLETDMAFDDARYDAHVVTEKTARGDPCAAFKN